MKYVGYTGHISCFCHTGVISSEIRKRRKKEKEEYVGCAGLLLVVDAILVLYYNPNWLLQMHKSPSIIPLWNFKTFENKKRKQSGTKETIPDIFLKLEFDKQTKIIGHFQHSIKKHFNMQMVANGSYAELDISNCLL